MGLGVAFGPQMADVGACGFLIQALPDASDDELALVEKNVSAMQGLATLLDHVIVKVAQRPHFVNRCCGRVIAQGQIELVVVARQSQVIGKRFDLLAHFPESELLNKFIAADGAAGDPACNRTRDYCTGVSARISQ